MTQATEEKAKILFFREYKHAGKIVETKHGVVEFTETGRNVDIEYRRYTQNYVDHADKQFYVVATRRRYSTLEKAAAAVIAHRNAAKSAT
ncbi:hypothetical protein [Comamonas thiooxydans]|uniref:hypothetical protein n=1 Tax=Comamonas thiooxydans TaxID=363952 RepID=UPI000B40BFE5|nr:hypothetical protein [Comamonas thiooxydans]